MTGREWYHLGSPEVPCCRRVHSSRFNLTKGRRRGSRWEPPEPVPLVDGWLKPVQQIASFVVYGGAGRAQSRFAFLGGLEAAGVPSRRRLDAVAMLQMPASCRSVSIGVDLRYLVTTLRALFWQHSSCSMREGAAQSFHAGVA